MGRGILATTNRDQVYHLVLRCWRILFVKATVSIADEPGVSVFCRKDFVTSSFEALLHVYEIRRRHIPDNSYLNIRYKLGVLPAVEQVSFLIVICLFKIQLRLRRLSTNVSLHGGIRCHQSFCNFLLVFPTPWKHRTSSCQWLNALHEIGNKYQSFVSTLFVCF